MNLSLRAPALGVLLLSGAALAQAPVLRDINTQAPSPTFLSGFSSSNTSIAQVGSVIYFAAESEGLGIELWRSDLTAPGTQLVWDPMPGENDAANTTIGNPQNLIAHNNKVFYTYWTLDKGRELWVYDPFLAPGPANPKLVKDIRSGVEPQNNGDGPSGFFVYNGFLYFLADDGARGRELWTTDGTAAGTYLVYETVPGAGTLHAQGGPFSPTPSSEFHEFGGVLYLTASGMLYRYVGVPTNFNVAQVDPASPVQGSITNLYGIGTNLFMRADSTGAPSFGPDNELYKYDGVAISLVADIIPGAVNGSNPSNFNELNGELIFVANDQIGPFGFPTNAELWKSDGTAAGTVMLAEINPTSSPFGGPNGSFPSEFLRFNGLLYFSADDGTNGQELWRTDGTSVGTVLAVDIQSGPGSSAPTQLTVLNATEFAFQANDGTNGSELFKSDGTNSGTSLVADIRPGSIGSSPTGIHRVAANQLVFSADDGLVSNELWKSNGTAAGTVLVKDIRQPLPGQSRGSSPSFFTDTLKGFALFAADDGVTGTEVYRTDGTTLGTIPFRDINPGSASSNAGNFTVAGSRIFFSADDGTNGLELWVTDGQSPIIGTSMVADIAPGSSSSFPGAFGTLSGGRVVFRADDGVNGTELWVSDGTLAGTTLIDIVPGSGGSFPDNHYYWRGKSYFVAFDQFGIMQIFTTDGTAAGTGAITGFGGGFISTFQNPFVEFDGKLWIPADDGATGTELYSIDAGGTVVALDLVPGGTGSGPGALTVWNGELYFLADVQTGLGYELYKTDGTLSGTVLVKDINPFPFTGSAFPTSGIMFGLDGGLVLFADDGVHGTEVWKSDGTTAGTVLLKDIVPGAESSSPSFGARIGSRKAFFSAAGRPVDDFEPWVTDGTDAGTFQIADVNPGNSRSNPSDFHLLNGLLVFSASDYFFGNELHVYYPGATAKPVGRSSGDASGYPTFRMTDPVLGGTITLSGEDVAPGAGIFTVLGLPVGGAGEFVEPTFRVQHVYGFNPNTILFSFLPNPNGTYSFSFPMPNIPGLVGLPFALQNWVGPTTMPFTVSLTPASYNWFGY